MFNRILLATASCGALIAAASPAFAQTTSTAPQAAEDNGGFQEIIVTARKRQERLMDVPVAVSALSAEQLGRYSTDSFAAIAQQTPQLVIGEAQGAAGGVIYLRGVGAGSSNPSTDQAVSINIDGVQVSRGSALRLGQYDLERVEVLKGPQALFYGKNSPAGIMSLISKEPGKDLEAEATVGYEFKAKQRFIEGAVSGPLGGGFGARLFAHYSKQDGWFRNIAFPIAGLTPGRTNKFGPEQDDLFVRGTLTYSSPDDRLNIKVKVNHGEVDRDRVGITATTQQYFCPTGTPQAGAGTTDCKIDRNYTTAAETPAKAALDPTFGDGTPNFNSKQTLASFSADYDLTDGLTISSVTGYYKIKEFFYDSFTGTNLPAISASNDLHYDQWTQELRLASTWDGPFNFLVGGFYQKSDLDFRNVLLVDIPAVVTAVSPIPNYNLHTRAYSFFGQARYKITDQFELSAGGRLSRERKSLTGTINNTPFTILNPRLKFKDFSPEITATWKPSSDLTVYASLREGFQSGGYNTLIQPLRSPALPTAPISDLSFDQTTVRGGEVGVKGYLADRQIRFDLTGYYYKYKDLQLSAFNPLTLSQTTRNAGGAKVRGIELNGSFRPRDIDGLELRSSASYNKATYSDFLGGCYAGQTVALGCAINPSNPSSPGTAGTAANPYNSQQQAGQQLARAPKWSLNGGFTYDREIGGGLGGSISFDAAYNSSFAPDIEANPAARQKAYWQLNANATLYQASDRLWAVSLIGRNLTNKLVVVSGGASPLTGGGTGTTTGVLSDQFGSLSAPRSIMAQLKFKLR